MAHVGKEEDTGAHSTTLSEAETSDREFASVLERLGIEMPPDLAPGVMAGYSPLRAMMELLRTVEIADA